MILNGGDFFLVDIGFRVLSVVPSYNYTTIQKFEVGKLFLLLF